MDLHPLSYLLFSFFFLSNPPSNLLLCLSSTNNSLLPFYHVATKYEETLAISCVLKPLFEGSMSLRSVEFVL